MKHIHADLMKQYAEDTSLVIEYRRNSRVSWNICPTQPSWHAMYEYRIVPPPKKTVDMWQWAYKNYGGDVFTSVKFYSSLEEASEHFTHIIGKIEGSKITVEVV